MRRPPCSVLVTGFEPFGDLRRNPSGDVVRALGRDPELRRLGVRVAVLPVHRHRAPRRLLELLDRWKPETVVMLGVAAGRAAVCAERLAVNCYRRAGDKGEGRPIRAGGPAGLFSTLPLAATTRRLAGPGTPAVISESAGTFTCNLVLFVALERAAAGGGAGPGRVGFIHLPATPESLPPGDLRPALPLSALVRSLHRLVRWEARRVSP